MQSKNYIIIQGSSKSHGNTRMIVDYILSKKEGQLVDLKTKNISYFDYDHQNIDDDFLGVIDEVLKCKIIVFATPVYWYSMSTVLKTFIDRISDLLKIRKDLGRQLRGKKMMVIACGSNKNEYPALWEPFKLTSEYLDMEYLGHAHTWVEEGKVSTNVRFTIDQMIDKLN